MLSPPIQKVSGDISTVHRMIEAHDQAVSATASWFWVDLGSVYGYVNKSALHHTVNNMRSKQ